MIRAWQQGSQSTSVRLLKHGISRDGCWSSQVLFYIVQCKVEHFFVCMCILGVSTIRLDINSFIGGIVMVDDDERRRGGKAAASLFWVREGGATLRYSQLLWKLMMPLKTLSIDTRLTIGSSRNCVRSVGLRTGGGEGTYADYSMCYSDRESGSSCSSSSSPLGTSLSWLWNNPRPRSKLIDKSSFTGNTLSKQYGNLFKARRVSRRQRSLRLCLKMQ